MLFSLSLLCLLDLCFILFDLYFLRSAILLALLAYLGRGDPKSSGAARMASGLGILLALLLIMIQIMEI